MKGLIACVVGVALTASSVLTPRVIADETGEVHTWSTSTEYVPADRVVNVDREDGVIQIMTPAMAAAPSTRVYLVNDDPAYDLSGAGDHLFLIGDGTAFQENSWRNTATFVSTGMHKEVVPISAEYRQDWLAVAAGDRPVRTLNTPRAVVETNEMAATPAAVVYIVNGDRYASSRYSDNGSQYRTYPKKKMKHRVSAAQYSEWKARRAHRRNNVATPASYSYTSTREVESVPNGDAEMAATTEVTESTVDVDALSNELFQMHSSWYMRNNDGEWFRAESWRGPFVRVKKGSVPREVRMSADRPSRIDMDVVMD